jgi:hypothetical protein
VQDTTTTARTGAVPLNDLPLGEQARYLRRTDPARAVAFDLTRPDTGMPCARMFYDASGGGKLDESTARALRQWAAMIADERAVIGGGR